MCYFIDVHTCLVFRSYSVSVLSGISDVYLLFLIFVTEKIIIPVSVNLHAFAF